MEHGHDFQDNIYVHLGRNKEVTFHLPTGWQPCGDTFPERLHDMDLASRAFGLLHLVGLCFVDGPPGLPPTTQKGKRSQGPWVKAPHIPEL